MGDIDGTQGVALKIRLFRRSGDRAGGIEEWAISQRAQVAGARRGSGDDGKEGDGRFNRIAKSLVERVAAESLAVEEDADLAIEPLAKALFDGPFEGGDPAAVVMLVNDVARPRS